MLFVVFQRLRAVHYRKQSQSQELQKEQTVCLLETFRLLSVSKSCISILWLFLLLHHRVHGCQGFGVFQLWGRLNLEQERTAQQKSACSKLWFQTLWSNETCLSKLSKVSSVFQDALVHFKASVIPTLTVQYDELFRLLLIITLCANVLQFTGLLSLHSTQAEFDRDVSKYTNLFPKQAEKLNKMSLKSRMHWFKT